MILFLSLFLSGDFHDRQLLIAFTRYCALHGILIQRIPLIKDLIRRHFIVNWHMKWVVLGLRCNWSDAIFHAIFLMLCSSFATMDDHFIVIIKTFKGFTYVCLRAPSHVDGLQVMGWWWITDSWKTSAWGEEGVMKSCSTTEEASQKPTEIQRN